MDALNFRTISTSLRAPRIMLLISDHEWAKQARWAIEALSRVWGGAGGVVVPVGSDGLIANELKSAMLAFDPDYVARLGVTAEQYENLWPGVLPLKLNGRRILAKSRRAKLIKEIDVAGNGSLSPVPDGCVESISGDLRPFLTGNFGRVPMLGKSTEVHSPLCNAPLQADTYSQAVGTTGSPMLDLAIYVRTGSATEGEKTFDLGSLSTLEAWNLACATHGQHVSDGPFARTNEGLTWIHEGMRQFEQWVVIGGQAEDFSLAMLLDRIMGGVVWLPSLGSSAAETTAAITQLQALDTHQGRELTITSASICRAEIDSLITEAWKHRFFKKIPDSSLSWIYYAPESINFRGSQTLCLADAWDRRQSIPVHHSDSGSVEMLSPPARIDPEISTLDRQWIVEHALPGNVLPSTMRVKTSSLLVSDQSPYETNVRPSRSGISFESSRWDFVLAGASPDGSLANPLLRWPSIAEAMMDSASSRGFSVMLSEAGRRTQSICGLYGSLSVLMGDLSGVAQMLLRTLCPDGSRNGPSSTGITFGGRNFGTYGSLRSVCATEWTDSELRTWLDDRLASGVLRRGLILRCLPCNSMGFYGLEDLAQYFKCQFCGGNTQLSQPQWRDPFEEPEWYYALHPLVVSFLRENGDLPLLAWKTRSELGRNASQAWFEFSVLQDDARIVELDFAGIIDGTLVVGEAKRGRTLDGSNAKARRRDVGKMLQGALAVGANELVLANSGTWSESTRDDVKKVTRSSEESQVKVRFLEGIDSGNVVYSTLE